MTARVLAAVLAASLLSGCGGLWTLRVSGWGVNAEVSADYRAERAERNAEAD